MKVLICPLSDPGYLYPAVAVGLELQQRHEVTVLARRSAAAVLAGTGLRVMPAEEYSGPGAMSVRRWFTAGAEQYQAVRRAARDACADLLLTSVLCHGALLAGERLDLPVVVIGLATHLWGYQAGGESEPEQPAVRAWRSRDMLRYYAQAREEAGLPPVAGSSPHHPLAGSALLLRGDPSLEYPGGVLPERVHHVGPCWWEPSPERAEVDEVAGRLDAVGKPVVYVHLGRFFGGASPWPRLNATFTGGPFQAVIEQGRSADPAASPDADITLVRKPWMGPFLDRAGLVLTNGTSAPVLGALLRGRPLGVSPAGSEQPLLAQACIRAGVAVHLPNTMNVDPVTLVRIAWDHPGLRERAQALRRRLTASPGASRAAQMIERIAAASPPRPAAARPGAHR